MRAYGVKRKDAGCCPGHDKFTSEYTCTSRAARKRRLRPAKRRARADGRREARKAAFEPWR
jgi:hypothetical protein